VLTSIPTSNLDVLTYHQYVDGYDYSCNISEALGIQKTAFAHVRSDLNSRGGTAVPIFISEGAMKYRHWETVTMTPQPLFFQCQATFAPSLLQWLDTKKGSGDNAKGFIWYTIGGNYWAFTDLIYPNGVKKPVYYSWKDWGQSLWAPMSVRNYNFPISQGRGMDDFGQSEQTGAYPPPLDDSAPGIDQPLDQNNQVPYPAPDLAENTAQGAGPSLDQNNQFPYPAPDLVEDAIPTEEPTLDQNTPLPPPTPSPVETPTPGVDPTTEQATPTPSLTPAP
jgi:hypothetical protein